MKMTGILNLGQEVQVGSLGLKGLICLFLLVVLGEQWESEVLG